MWRDTENDPFKYSTFIYSYEFHGRERGRENVNVRMYEPVHVTETENKWSVWLCITYRPLTAFVGFPLGNPRYRYLKGSSDALLGYSC